MFFGGVVAVGIGKGENFGDFLVGFSLLGYFGVVYNYLCVEYLLVNAFIKIVRDCPTNIPWVRLAILLAGIRLSNCVDIEVEVSLRLIVVDCLFCNTFPKRSERV